MLQSFDNLCGSPLDPLKTVWYFKYLLVFTACCIKDVWEAGKCKFIHDFLKEVSKFLNFIYNRIETILQTLAFNCYTKIGSVQPVKSLKAGVAGD